jgi:putative oxidoreductase
MIDSKSAPYAATALRVSLGLMFLTHSVYLKAFVYTLPGTAQFFESLGLPGILAYAVFFAEAIGGTLLILGAYARWVALALLPVLIGAAWTHWPNGWLFTNANGGWEYPAFLAATAVVQFLLGDGAYAVSHRLLGVKAKVVAPAA